jgi:hypothetical protein
VIVLGTCANCTTCGDVACDEVVILIGNGLEPANALSFFTVNEGAARTITVARLADHEIGYHGTPADYETAEGSPPPVSEGAFYLDWDTGDYWQNNGGVFTIETPPNHGTGAVEVEWTVNLTECGCNHMWTHETHVVNWADGDTANKTFTLTAPTHAGTVPFWTCPGNPYYGESATLDGTVNSVGTGSCANLGYGVTLTAVCTHTVTNSGWGTGTPYQVRKWGGIYQPSAGIDGFRQTENYLREQSEAAGDGQEANYAKEFAEEGDVVLEESTTIVSYGSFNGRFTRPVALTAPVVLPITQDGLATTAGTTDPSNGAFVDSFSSAGRYIAGAQTVIIQGVVSGSGSWSIEKNAVSVASGGFFGATNVSYTPSPNDSTGSGTYQLIVTDGTYTSTSDAVEIVMLDQTVATVADASVDVAGSGGGETWQWDGAMTDQVNAAPHGVAESRMNTAVGLYADGNLAGGSGNPDVGYYGWDQVEPDEWTWRIRAGNANYDFSDPGFDPSKTYAYTGSSLPAEPFDPGDWTEIADTGYDFQQVVSGYSQTLGASGILGNIARPAGRMVDGNGYYCWKCTIDATRSASGSPYPYKVEIRIKEYEDDVLISTGAWIDITDTVYELDEPASMGGATYRKHRTFEERLTPLTTGCTVAVSPTFICHPGLSC